jgi:hypothetical protein
VGYFIYELVVSILVDTKFAFQESTLEMVGVSTQASLATSESAAALSLSDVSTEALFAAHRSTEGLSLLVSLQRVLIQGWLFASHSQMS